MCANCISPKGLCLSGCEDETENEKLEKYFVGRHSGITRSCKVASDTIGSLMTCSPTGGIVLIAGQNPIYLLCQQLSNLLLGTGSNSLFYSENGTKERCGGWGHIIGDYGNAHFRIFKSSFQSILFVDSFGLGSAFWISMHLIKSIIEAQENFNPTDLDTTNCLQEVYDHFGVSFVKWIECFIRKNVLCRLII